MAEIKKLKLTEVKVSGYNPRQHFDPKKMAELEASIKEKGIIEPVVVRPRNGKYELVCGERRLRASIKAKTGTIPVIVRQLTDEQALEFQVIENLQREDLDPIDEALGFKAMLEKCKYTQETLAGKVGKSQPYIANRLRLLELPGPMKDAITRKIIDAGHGMVLLRVGDKTQRQKLFNEIQTEGLSVRGAVVEMREVSNLLSKESFDKKDCAACENNGSVQEQLFVGDTGYKGECFDRNCFIKKVNAAVNRDRSVLLKKGFKVMAEGKARPSCGNNSVELSGEYGDYKKELKGNYKKHCLNKCPKLVFVIVKQDYGQNKGRLKIEEHCFNSACHTKLTRGAEKPDRQESSGSGNNEFVKAKAANRVRDTRRIFWREKLLADNDRRVKNVVKLDVLLDKLGTSEANDLVPWRPSDSFYRAWSIPKLYGLGDKKVVQLIDQASRKIVETTLDDGELKFLCEQRKLDVKKQFVINEDYLFSHTKGELVKLAKEIGLKRYLVRFKEMSPGALDGMKKPGLIDLFLKVGFKLQGKVPKEISK